MKRQTVKFAILAATTFGCISLAAAQGPGEGGPRGGHMRGPGGPEGHGGPGGPPMEMIARHLGLSEEQQAQWKAIHEKERAEAEPLMKSAGVAKEAFDKALESENPDAAAIGQAALAMREARRKVEAQHQATFEAVKAILTPEQLAKVEEMEKHVGRPGGPGEFHRGPNGPGRPEGRGKKAGPGSK